MPYKNKIDERLNRLKNRDRINAAKRRRYLLHREELKLKMREYYRTHKVQWTEYLQKNRDYISQRQKEYRLKHLESRRAVNLQYYYDHKEKMLPAIRDYNKLHWEQKKTLRREWAKANPKNIQAYKANRKEWFKKAGRLLKSTVQQVYEDNIKQYGTLTCYLCGLGISFGEDSLEHRNPLSRGGANEYENLQVAHMKCNVRKHNKTEAEYRTQLKGEVYA